MAEEYVLRTYSSHPIITEKREQSADPSPSSSNNFNCNKNKNSNFKCPPILSKTVSSSSSSSSSSFSTSTSPFSILPSTLSSNLSQNPFTVPLPVPVSSPVYPVAFINTETVACTALLKTVKTALNEKTDNFSGLTRRKIFSSFILQSDLNDIQEKFTDKNSDIRENNDPSNNNTNCENRSSGDRNKKDVKELFSFKLMETVSIHNDKSPKQIGGEIIDLTVENKFNSESVVRSTAGMNKIRKENYHYYCLASNSISYVPSFSSELIELHSLTGEFENITILSLINKSSLNVNISIMIEICNYHVTSPFAEKESNLDNNYPNRRSVYTTSIVPDVNNNNNKNNNNNNNDNNNNNNNNYNNNNNNNNNNYNHKKSDKYFFKFSQQTHTMRIVGIFISSPLGQVLDNINDESSFKASGSGGNARNEETFKSSFRIREFRVTADSNCNFKSNQRNNYCSDNVDNNSKSSHSNDNIDIRGKLDGDHNLNNNANHSIENIYGDNNLAHFKTTNYR